MVWNGEAVKVCISDSTADCGAERRNGTVFGMRLVSNSNSGCWQLVVRRTCNYDAAEGGKLA